MTVTETQFLTTDQLAERYEKSAATIRKWRVVGYGPPFYELPRTEAEYGTPRVRYQLHDLLSWEEANGITPINHF